MAANAFAARMMGVTPPKPSLVQKIADRAKDFAMDHPILTGTAIIGTAVVISYGLFTCRNSFRNSRRNLHQHGEVHKRDN